jgi:hypothetical protein
MLHYTRFLVSGLYRQYIRCVHSSLALHALICESRLFVREFKLVDKKVTAAERV